MLTDRRTFISSIVGAGSLLIAGKPGFLIARKPGLAFKFILASCMYGYMDLADILPEVTKTGALAIDIWPKVHGNQREQWEGMGEERFRQMLDGHNVKLGCITQFKLGPFNLQDELRLAAKFGCDTIVTGGEGPKGLEGAELKQAVKAFVEKMKPQIAVAEETGVKIAIENHGNNLIESPDALKWLLEFSPSEYLGIALAPYHLPQDEKFLAGLIRTLDKRLLMFYAWQYGMGCMEKLPKEQELLQLPGRGSLDFTPLLAALADIGYQGWMEIFMHPVPRGVPILDTASKVTAEINLARKYLTACAGHLLDKKNNG